MLYVVDGRPGDGSWYKPMIVKQCDPRLCHVCFCHVYRQVHGDRCLGCPQCALCRGDGLKYTSGISIGCRVVEEQE